MISREPTLARLATAQAQLLEPYGLTEASLTKALRLITEHRVDDADLYFKHEISRDTPADQRRLSDEQIAWLDRMQASGQVAAHFNTGLFTKGEAPMVLSYTTSPAYHMVAEETDRYQAAEFSEGHYIQIEVAGLLKNAQEKELARQFLAFMLQPGFQDTIPTNNWMMPVTKTSEPLPEA